ncbi:hypothetical protein A3SI_19231 [Nitritalea halalkaliphila LW7]|uniref:Uncharacterized protein n=1 Tax=Nitritalea halalkaliphila LW7 TaxID=1189621 RepID=I5BTE4_9BACT|nr:hypothetical protein [Nitritalea halalkaliphila]EIM72846.1 hypothetical protein A3SI_19231 [Nitritalea halalkaliphila LW7]
MADQDGEHEHSEEEYHLLDIISNPLHTFDSTPVYPTQTAFALLYENTLFYASCSLLPSGQDANSLRGPPSLSSFIS